MVAPYYIMNDGTPTVTFATYATGFADVVYDNTNSIATATSLQKVTQNASAAALGTVNLYALQLTGALSGSGTINIGSGGLINNYRIVSWFEDNR